MTKEQWIKHRQENSDTPWHRILAYGYDAIQCDCGLEGCMGWKIAKMGKSRPVETENEAA